MSDVIRNPIAVNAKILSRDARVVLGLLEKIESGTLRVRMPNGEQLSYGAGEPTVQFRINDQRVFSRVLARGDIGFCESYIAGEWDSNDLTGLLKLLASNRDVLRKAVYGSWFNLLTAKLRHFLNRNNRAGSKRNIMAHYDLGNEFYRLWLDPGMVYSSALFPPSTVDENKNASLQAAQTAKHQRILDRLCAMPQQHVLEIGCGWGGFAEMAVANNLKITGLTLSPAQLEWARQRVPQADLRLQDYRDLSEQFDHVVSVEMIEAVGERWWPTYFNTIAHALKPGGKAIIQGIVIRDDLFAEYRKGTDFIQQYIFPGGMLPSRSVVREIAARQGLAIHNEHAFGIDYATTLNHWRQNFEENWLRIKALGFDEEFRRLWRMYLCYCEAGFLAGTIDVVQFEFGHAAP